MRIRALTGGIPLLRITFLYTFVNSLQYDPALSACILPTSALTRQHCRSRIVNIGMRFALCVLLRSYKCCANKAHVERDALNLVNASCLRRSQVDTSRRRLDGQDKNVFVYSIVKRETGTSVTDKGIENM